MKISQGADYYTLKYNILLFVISLCILNCYTYSYLSLYLYSIFNIKKVHHYHFRVMVLEFIRTIYLRFENIIFGQPSL